MKKIEITINSVKIYFINLIYYILQDKKNDGKKMIRWASKLMEKLN